MDDFKARLAFYMRKNGFNPTSLSRKAQLNATAVRDILEHKETPNPRIDTFIKLCQALGVSPCHLSPDFERLRSLCPASEGDNKENPPPHTGGKNA